MPDALCQIVATCSMWGTHPGGSRSSSRCFHTLTWMETNQLRGRICGAVVPAVARAVHTLSWTGSCRWWSWASPGWGRSHSGWRRSRVWPRPRSGAADSRRWNTIGPWEAPWKMTLSFPVTSSPSFTDLTPLVTSANCKRSYFLRSWCVGMWPWGKQQQTGLTRIWTGFDCHFDENLRFWPAASSQAAGRWESSFCSSDWSDGSDGRSTTGRPPLHTQKKRSSTLYSIRLIHN